MGREILFIDPSLHDWQRIAANVRLDVDIVILDPQLDPLAQIVDTFASAAMPAAVHFASLGDSQHLTLGMRRIDLTQLPGHVTPVSAVSGSVVYADDAMLYGTEFSSSDDAFEFLDALQKAGRKGRLLASYAKMLGFTSKRLSYDA